MAGTLSIVKLYTRQGCHLCEAVEGILRQAMQRKAFELSIIDIDQDAQGRAMYSNDIPVVIVNGREIARHRLDRAILDRALDDSSHQP